MPARAQTSSNVRPRKKLSPNKNAKSIASGSGVTAPPAYASAVAIFGKGLPRFFLSARAPLWHGRRPRSRVRRRVARVPNRSPCFADGGVAFHHFLPLSVTIDHRVATGGDAARFMSALIASLERIS